MAMPPDPAPMDRRERVRVDEDLTTPVDATRPLRRVGPYERLEPVEGVERRQRVVRDAAAESRMRVAKATEVIWLLVGFLEGLLAIRLLLKLIAANPSNPFASAVYGVTDFFLAPFFGITGSPATDGVVLEIPTIIAMLVYLLFAWVIVKLIWVIFEPPTSRSTSSYERDDL